MSFYDDVLCSINGRKITFCGNTCDGRKIPLLKIGGKPNFLLLASVHAREYITTLLTVKMLNACTDDVNFHFLPILNVDGVLAVTDGIDSIKNERLKNKMIATNGGRDFSLWKANANCVDINVNFDADWGKGRNNVFCPAPASFVGKKPHSEPETKAVVKLLHTYDYPLVVCYHSLGEVVYWGYRENEKYKDESSLIASKLNYSLQKKRLFLRWH